MRIAFFVTSFPALSATFVLNQAVGLIERGHEVSIYCDRLGGSRDEHADVRRLDMLQRTYAASIPRTAVGRVAVAPLVLGRNLLSDRVATRESLSVGRYGHLARSLNLLYTLDAFRHMTEQVGTFDVVHAHFGPLGVKAQFLRDHELLHGPLLTSFYGYDLTRMAQQKQMHVYRRLFARGDMMIPLCGYFQDLLVEYGCPREMTRVHHIGVNTDRFALRERTAPDAGQPTRLFSIARLVEKKGIEYAIHAVAALRKAGIDVQYHVAGDGPLRRDLQALIDFHRLKDRVKILGWQPNERVAELLDEAHIFLAPSVTASDGDQEGTPTVIMEASAKGLPVVATRHSGISEIVVDGETGLLVEERDVDQLADAIGTLIQQPAQWSVMGRAGRAHIEREFNIGTLNDTLIDIYQQAREAYDRQRA